MSQLGYLHGIDLTEFDDEIQPIQTASPSIIGVVGTAGMGPVNVPTLILGSATTAEQIYGVNQDDGFTLPGILAAIFEQSGAVVVAVNVLDPTVYQLTDQIVDVTLNPNTGTLPLGYIDSYAVGTSIDLGLTVILASTLQPVALTNVTAEDASETVTCASTAGLYEGMTVTGTGIYAGSTISNVASDGITLTLSNATTSIITDGTATATTTAGIAFLPSGASDPTYFDILGNSLENIEGLAVGTQIRVSYTGTPVVGTDFTIDLVTGVVTRVINSSVILPGSTLAFTVVCANNNIPLSTMQTLVIGNEGENTGLYALIAAQTQVFVTPKIIIAPYCDEQKPAPNLSNPVAATMEIVVESLSAIGYVNCPDTTPTDAVAHVNDFGGSDRLMFLFPRFIVLSPSGDGTYISEPMAARWAGITAMSDNANGFWFSPSNNPINGISGISQTITFGLNNPNTIANYLNGNNCSTVINFNGYLTWGDRMANGQFITVRRVADAVNNAIMQAHMPYVDKPISAGLVTNILQNVNNYLTTLTNLGAILGGIAWCDPALNTISVLQGGQLFVDYKFTAPVPLEHLSFRSHLVNDYASTIFANTVALTSVLG